MSTDVREARALVDLDRLRELPQAADAVVPLPVLTPPGGSRDPRAQLTRLGELFGATSAPLSMGLQLTEGEEKGRTLFLDAGPEGTKVTDRPARKLDLEIILSADTWQELAAGAVSPLEVFAGGRMRVRGDMAVAQLVLRKLQRADVSSDATTVEGI